MESLSSVRLARNSVTMPMPVLIRMTRPNTASFHEPVMSTMTMAVKMMPLNNVNTLARTISARERDVDDFTSFVWPRSTRSRTSAAVSPFSVTSGICAWSSPPCAPVIDTLCCAFAESLMFASLLNRTHAGNTPVVRNAC